MATVNARLSFGSCPYEVEYMENFDGSRFAGRWYQQFRTMASTIYTLGTNCVT